MKLLLTAIAGARDGETITILSSESVTFGRTSACDLSFETDAHMSSRHFKVSNLGEHAQVEDLGSTNGTWLNTDRILSERLREGDRIRAGRTILTVEFLAEGGIAATQEPTQNTSTPQQPAQDFTSATPQIPLRDRQRPADTDFANRSEPASPASVEKPGGRPLTPFGDSIDFDQQQQPNSALPNSSNSPLISAESVDQQVHKAVGGPLDSVSDLGPLDGSVEWSPASPTAPASAERHNNPLSESSCGLQLPREQVQSQLSRSDFQFMQRTTAEESGDSFGILLDSLSRKWSIQLILHFQKIRNSGLSCSSSRVLFNWLPTSAHCYSPILVGWNEVCQNPPVLSMLPRLCRSDACIALLGESPEALETQLVAMQGAEVEGFSEQGGFLPIYWPSGLISILDASGKHVCQNLFANNVQGALMCSPWGRKQIVGVANEELVADLVALEFAQSGKLLA